MKKNNPSISKECNFQEQLKKHIIRNETLEPEPVNEFLNYATKTRYTQQFHLEDKLFDGCILRLEEISTYINDTKREIIDILNRDCELYSSKKVQIRITNVIFGYGVVVHLHNVCAKRGTLRFSVNIDKPAHDFPRTKSITKIL